jgi:predicted MFS family arabinose efflux permease
MKTQLNHKIAYLLSLGIFVKIIVDTSFQLFNPFLTIIAAGTGISAVYLGGIIGLRSILGLSAPLIGTVADKVGYRKIMQWSLVLLGLGMIIAGTSTRPVVFAAGIILTGIGQAGFTPNIQAHVSSKLSYERRAMGIGILEYSWALAGMVGLLAAGFLIEKFTWRTPFIFLGSLLLLSSLLFFSLPESKKKGWEKNSLPLGTRLTGFIQLGPNARSAWGTILLQGFTMFSIMHLMIIHGGWLVDRFSLSPGALGTAALIMGITDLSASVSVSLFVDKIGKKRSVAMGLAGMVIGFSALPFLNGSIITAIIGLIIPRTFFEFALVSNVALVSEQVPAQRGKMLSLASASGLMGITAASVFGPLSYYGLGIGGLSLISLITTGIALTILLVMVKES